MRLDPVDLVDSLQKLIDAQRLLDDILVHYDIYDGDFTIPDREKGWSGEPMFPTLNQRIRTYQNFDDSE